MLSQSNHIDSRITSRGTILFVAATIAICAAPTVLWNGTSLGQQDAAETSDTGIPIVEKATLKFDALEATVDPTKHCIFVADTKRNTQTGALRLDLERGETYTVKATGEAFMTSEVGADADPFPGLVVYYPTDEEDCYALRLAILKPGDSLTFRRPWLISADADDYALAFFLAIAPGEHRGSYKLSVMKAKDDKTERHGGKDDIIKVLEADSLTLFEKELPQGVAR